jgi:DNA-damage-inducible protein D
MDNQLAVFENKPIRHVEHNGKTYFSLVDIIEILTDSPNPRNYWSMLKKKETQLYTISVQLKMMASDGKMRETDCADTEGVLRIIQSVPSPKAEPFKMWMAGLGKQSLDETNDPELGFERLTALYKAKGYADDWIENRLKTIGIRKELTDEWQKRGVKEGQEYAHLTATIAKNTFGVTPSEHSQLKGLEKENLRDHMTNLELLFTALGEEFTRNYAVNDDAQGFNDNQEAAMKGGNLAGDMRRNAEQKGMKVVSPSNFLEKQEEKTKHIVIGRFKPPT